jgi:hypothetical protein
MPNQLSFAEGHTIEVSGPPYSADLKTPDLAAYRAKICSISELPDHGLGTPENEHRSVSCVSANVSDQFSKLSRVFYAASGREK